jgi:uncharacterized protein
MINNIMVRLRFLGLTVLLVLIGFITYAGAGDLPSKPNPPRLVNDFAHMLTAGEADQLERKLLEYEQTSSTQITIVTIDELGDQDVSDFAIKLGKAWGVGKAGKNNGVVVLASLKDHKINISTGKGVEGALTDLMCGRIIRNEIVPAFKQKNFFEGFSKASDAIIKATTGEYHADAKEKKGGGLPIKAFVVIVIFIIIVISFFTRGGGGGRGGRGGGGNTFADIATGMLIGNMLNGGNRGGGSWGGGGSSGGGGGFGGFGGGDFGGGGASGDW